MEEHQIQPLPENSRLEELLEENLRYNRMIYADSQKIKRYMLWRVVFNIIWFVIIVGPIIAAIIWLPPFFREAYDGYSELLGQTQGAGDLLNQLNGLR